MPGASRWPPAPGQACLVGTVAPLPAQHCLAVEPGREAEFHASAFTPSSFWTWLSGAMPLWLTLFLALYQLGSLVTATW